MSAVVTPSRSASAVCSPGMWTSIKNLAWRSTRVPLNLLARCPVVEQAVLETFDCVVERLDRVEVTVDDDVQQAVDECPDAKLQQVVVVFPASHHFIDVEAVPLADGDDAAWEDER